MAPSVAETISHVADEKISAVSLNKNKAPEPNVEDASAPAVQEPDFAPATKSELQEHESKIDNGPDPSNLGATPENQHKEPLKLSGSLDSYESFDVTPVIGKEFVGVNLAEWLNAPNSDDLIRDLAITSILPSSQF